MLTGPARSAKPAVAGICLEGGQPVVARIQSPITRSSSFVFGNGVAHVTRQLLARGAPGAARWQRLRALPEPRQGRGDLSLTVNNVTLPGGAYDANRDLDPIDPDRSVHGCRAHRHRGRRERVGRRLGVGYDALDLRAQIRTTSSSSTAPSSSSLVSATPTQGIRVSSTQPTAMAPSTSASKVPASRTTSATSSSPRTRPSPARSSARPSRAPAIVVTSPATRATRRSASARAGARRSPTPTAIACAS